MAHLLARLGPRAGPDRRVIHARGQDREQVVGPSVAAMAEARVVLLAGEAEPWTHAVPVRISPWPRGLDDLQRDGASAKHKLDDIWGARGLWSLDPRGEPCELVWGRDPEHVALLLNYSGWRFADLPPGPHLVRVERAALGTVWILDPAAVPMPRHVVSLDEPRERTVLRTSRIGASLRPPGPTGLPRL